MMYVCVVYMMVCGIVCSGIENRQSCIAKDDYGLCVRCNIEYYLEDNVCYLCSNACKKCESIDRCEVCMNGYRLSSDGQCVWAVVRYMYMFNAAFCIVILLLVVYLIISYKNKNIFKILAGDDVKAQWTTQNNINTPPSISGPTSGLKSNDSEYSNISKRF